MRDSGAWRLGEKRGRLLLRCRPGAWTRTIMNRTFPVLAGQLWPLVNALVEKFGYPHIYEELAIFVQDDSQLRITLTRDSMTLAWIDPGEVLDAYGSRNHTIAITPDRLKHKLELISLTHNDLAILSSTSVFSFATALPQLRAEIRTETLIGQTVSLRCDREYDGDASTVAAFKKSSKLVAPFVSKDTAARIAGVTAAPERYLVQTAAGRILNTKIFDFCKRNGITNPTGQPYSYKQVLQSKSNDFSLYAELFGALTGNDLLGTKPSTIPNLALVPQVSIIIPYFNSPSSILYTLRSIIGQTCFDSISEKLEVIVVDDGSTQPVTEILGEIGLPLRLRIVSVRPNRGVSHARKLGVTHAVGDILIFLDSDVVLSSTYLEDHISRNMIIENAVFVSFKENIPSTPLPWAADVSPISERMPNFQKDLRVTKTVNRSAVGSYKVERAASFNILEETNFFKDFHGSRVFGVYDLACMIVGHNFSARKSEIMRADPFSDRFKGWGMEDVFLGIRTISSGCFVVPVISCGVFHIDHPPRSGSDRKKRLEYQQNTAQIDRILELPAARSYL